MPRRISTHFGTASQQHPNSSVNDVVAAISRKLTSSHIEHRPVPSPSSSRRASFSMDSILRPNKEKKRNDSKERNPAERLIAAVSKKGNSKTKNSAESPRLAPIRSCRLEVVDDSPPLVSYGRATQSTGALFSGRLKLFVEDPSGEVNIKKLVLTFRSEVITKKPIGKDCPDCRIRHEDLKSETLISDPKIFKKDEDNQFPISHLFEGHLPATTVATLGSMTYQVVAVATTAMGETIDIVHPLVIQRAMGLGSDKTSIRIFPPTNLTCKLVLNSIVHPIGVFPVSMVVSGIVEKRKDMTTRWRLRKVMWHVEENLKMVADPCDKHVGRVNPDRPVVQTTMRKLGNNEYKEGWKSDFDTPGGEILFDFEAALSYRAKDRAVCDVVSTSALTVTHSLVVELIVAEEFVSARNPRIITPTGSARVLRMHFNIVVTERGGMNVSWDEEQPPLYEDVPARPPGYIRGESIQTATIEGTVTDYTGAPLEYSELERLQSTDPDAPPMYRERSDDGTGDNSTRLPTRVRLQHYESEAGPSGIQPHERRAGWTEDELFAEPQYRLRRESSTGDGAQAGEVDFGHGSEGAAPTTD